MGTYPITIVVILAGAIGVIFLLRFGIRQNAAAAARDPESDAPGSLAVLSFVTALILPVIGVVLAHVTLNRIIRGQAGGRIFAYSALWVGYLLIVLELGVLVYLYETNYWT
jgi:NADH:ubiquinone oxidoreductase subunit 6 (subunit J)